VFKLSGRSTSEFFGVIRVRRQHSVPPANRNDPASERQRRLADAACEILNRAPATSLALDVISVRGGPKPDSADEVAAVLDPVMTFLRGA
jgi:hypothetical protein